MTYDLTDFGLREMTSCGMVLRDASAEATCMEDAARRMVRHLHDGLVGGPSGARATVLVRFYKTHEYERLGPDLQAFARGILGDAAPPPGMKCLTLLASAGQEPAWNQRTTSRGHQAIPLPSPEVVEQLPMISQLVRQFGLDLSDVVQPKPALLVEREETTFNVFHVADAVDSPYIPAQQDFVQPYQVRSVLGFGGLLPPADLYAVILFSRVPIDRDTATLFQTVALSAKLGVLPFANGPVFETDAPASRT